MRQLDIGEQGPKRARIGIEPGHDAIEWGQAGDEEHSHAIGQDHAEVEIRIDGHPRVLRPEPHAKRVPGTKGTLIEAQLDGRRQCFCPVGPYFKARQPGGNPIMDERECLQVIELRAERKLVDDQGGGHKDIVTKASTIT